MSGSPQIDPEAGTVAAHGRGDNPDPLCASVRLLHSGLFFPYGFPVHIHSNHPAVIECADLSWGKFERRAEANPVLLRVLVSEGEVHTPHAPVYRAQGNLLTVVADSRNFGSCDLNTGFGFAHLGEHTVLDSDFFCFHFLEGMVYTLLNAGHILTLHAACVEHAGRGVLLVGESGAGKSCFAYACSRRGWTYVSDDASSLLLNREDRTAVGNPRTIRFRPSASMVFPELKGRVKTRNGKPTLEIKTVDLRDLKFAEECDVACLIFLKRSAETGQVPNLLPMSKTESRRRIYKSPLPPELPIHESRKRAVQRLLSAPTYILEYSAFEPAIEMLEQLIANARVDPV